MFEHHRDLEIFLALADVDRIVAAADRLAIGQPALTRAIARLEERFGAPLPEPKCVVLHATFGKHVCDRPII